MGIKPFKDSCCNTNPNPNKNNYSIVNVETYGEYAIYKVLYHGCTTFSGLKLLLLKLPVNLLNGLDPHLLGNGHMVIARFEPNPRGYRLARACIKELQNEE